MSGFEVFIGVMVCALAVVGVIAIVNTIFGSNQCPL